MITCSLFQSPRQLTQLPTELEDYFLEFLSIKDLCRLSLVSKKNRDFVAKIFADKRVLALANLPVKFKAKLMEYARLGAIPIADNHMDRRYPIALCKGISFAIDDPEWSLSTLYPFPRHNNYAAGILTFLESTASGVKTHLDMYDAKQGKQTIHHIECDMELSKAIEAVDNIYKHKTVWTHDLGDNWTYRITPQEELGRTMNREDQYLANCRAVVYARRRRKIFGYVAVASMALSFYKGIPPQYRELIRQGGIVSLAVSLASYAQNWMLERWKYQYITAGIVP